MNTLILILSALATVLPATPAAVVDDAKSATVIEQFANPPTSCRPKVWWHWMNGNITRDGIRKDLLWMNSVGIGGVQNFDAGLSVPVIVNDRLPFMSPGWKDAFNYAVNLADSLGFEYAIPSSGGWSDTGAPWVKPEDAMKTLKWKSMDITGGRSVEMALPVADSVCGKYMTHSFFPVHHPEYDFYRDIAVVAVKVPDSDRPVSEMGAVVTASDGSDVSALTDGDLNNVCRVAPGDGGAAWIQFEFPESLTIRSFFAGRKDDFRIRGPRHWEVSDDGKCFRPIGESLPDFSYIPFMNFNLPESSGRFFRLVDDVPGDVLDYTELTVSSSTKVQMDTEKAGFFVQPGIRDFYPTPEYTAATATGDVVNLTSFCKDGVLNWDAPEGRWRIFRFGYSIRGRKNNPASPEAAGLEIDKLDPEVTSRYYHRYLDDFNRACEGNLGKKLKYLVNDSFEAGCQSWTANMPEEFLKRKGYDLIPWLPALAGQVIGSSDTTDRFLQDWRQTIGEMLVDYHYNALDPVLAEYGMKRYTEFHESGRAFPVDGMEVKRHAAVPMAAFWCRPDSLTSVKYMADIREAASVAHIYGQNIVAAESFTTQGSDVGEDGRLLSFEMFPCRMKSAADIAMASGLNSFVLHCSIHQPVDDKVPGLALDSYGHWLNRHETWADEAGPWLSYLARSSYLLRQGKFVSEIGYFVSETSNPSDRFCHELPAVPAGYSFDYVDKAVLAERFNYAALMIDPEVSSMSMDVLRSIKALADRGVIIAGNEPLAMLGLSGKEEEFRSLVRDIWYSGRNNVIPFEDMASALEQAGQHRDVDFVAAADSSLMFVHRRLEDGELYWICSTASTPRKVDVSFNIRGHKPVVLDAETGKTGEISYSTHRGRTVIPVQFKPHDAKFILFPSESAAEEFTAPERVRRSIPVEDSEWTVRFQEGRGAPESITLPELKSLSENAVPGVRYFSGKAVYSRTFNIPKPHKGEKCFINLGRVYSMARVMVNGQDCGLAWKAPYEIEITDALVRGANLIEVEVINSWANRIIGDLQPGAEKITWTSTVLYTKDSPMHPSGLVGPVRIEMESEK